MSMYYYLVCDEHKVVSEMVARQGLLADWSVAPFGLEHFLSEHGGCKPILITEHDERVDDYEKVRES